MTKEWPIHLYSPSSPTPVPIAHVINTVRLIIDLDIVVLNARLLPVGLVKWLNSLTIHWQLALDNLSTFIGRLESRDWQSLALIGPRQQTIGRCIQLYNIGHVWRHRIVSNFSEFQPQTDRQTDTPGYSTLTEMRLQFNFTRCQFNLRFDWIFLATRVSLADENK